jgi:hypothetical protein
MTNPSIISCTVGDALKLGFLKEFMDYSAPASAHFRPGIIIVTPSVQALAGDSTPIKTMLDRHLSGDFGNFGHFTAIEISDHELLHGALATDDSGKLNKLAILGKYPSVLSEYSLGNQTIWVATEDVNGTETRTTVMLPSEY